MQNTKTLQSNCPYTDVCKTHIHVQHALAAITNAAMHLAECMTGLLSQAVQVNVKVLFSLYRN
jgi:hypothetical protein